MNNGDSGTPPGKKNRRRLFLVLGIILLGLAILLATYSLVVYSAWQQAEEGRIEEERLALQEELAKQMNLARDDINAGDLERSLRRLEWILDHYPEYPGAAELLEVARSNLTLRLTPQATATPTPLAIQTPGLDSESDPAGAFIELERLVKQEQWSSLVVEVVAFQGMNPNYKRQETNTMLYNGSVNLGLELVQGNQIESGLYHIAQAEKLGDLPQEALDYRLWAELYLLAIGFYGVDWWQAIYQFRGLCDAAPYYQDSCARLYESLLALGDHYSAVLDWCPAEELYFEATLVQTSESLSQKIEDSRIRCLEATPTPTVTITSTPSITPSITTTPTGTPQ